MAHILRTSTVCHSPHLEMTFRTDSHLFNSTRWTKSLFSSTSDWRYLVPLVTSWVWLCFVCIRDRVNHLIYFSWKRCAWQTRVILYSVYATPFLLFHFTRVIWGKLRWSKKLSFLKRIPDFYVVKRRDVVFLALNNFYMITHLYHWKCRTSMTRTSCDTTDIIIRNICTGTAAWSQFSTSQIAPVWHE